MQYRPKSRSLVIFYLLVTYILVQFAWWAYLMIDLKQEVQAQKLEIASLSGDEALANTIQENASGPFWMVIGEGGVFLLILGLGIMQIRRSYKKELALAQQQQNFLMSVTHELKSPIASVKLWLQTLQRRNLPEEQREDILQKTVKDTDRLHQLVENILTATRIENSAIPVHKEKTNISALIKEQLTSASETIGKSHPTELDIAGNIYMDADPAAINSIVLNLYENAVKYSDSGEPINVKLQSGGEGIVFSVADHGKGISSKDRDRIFEKFFRAGDEATRTTKGTGLGLYIVRKLASQHNGTVNATANQPKGTVFTVKFKAKTT